MENESCDHLWGLRAYNVMLRVIKFLIARGGDGAGIRKNLLPSPSFPEWTAGANSNDPIQQCQIDPIRAFLERFPKQICI